MPDVSEIKQKNLGSSLREFFRTKTAIGASFENERLKNEGLALYAEIIGKERKEAKELEKKKLEADIRESEARASHYTSQADINVYKLNKLKEAGESEDTTVEELTGEAELAKKVADAQIAESKAREARSITTYNGIQVRRDPDSSQLTLPKAERDRIKNLRASLLAVSENEQGEISYDLTGGERRVATKQVYDSIYMEYVARIANKMTGMSTQARRYGTEDLINYGSGIVEEGLDYAEVYLEAKDIVTEGLPMFRKKQEERNPEAFDKKVLDEFYVLLSQKGFSTEKAEEYLKEDGRMGFTLNDAQSLIDYYAR